MLLKNNKKTIRGVLIADYRRVQEDHKIFLFTGNRRIEIAGTYNRLKKLIEHGGEFLSIDGHWLSSHVFLITDHLIVSDDVLLNGDIENCYDQMFLQEQIKENGLLKYDDISA